MIKRLFQTNFIFLFTVSLQQSDIYLSQSTCNSVWEDLMNCVENENTYICLNMSMKNGIYQLHN